MHVFGLGEESEDLEGTPKAQGEQTLRTQNRDINLTPNPGGARETY